MPKKITQHQPRVFRPKAKVLFALRARTQCAVPTCFAIYPIMFMCVARARSFGGTSRSAFAAGTALRHRRWRCFFPATHILHHKPLCRHTVRRFCSVLGAKRTIDSTTLAGGDAIAVNCCPCTFRAFRARSSTQFVRL